MARKRDEAAFAARQRQILRAAERLFVAHGFHQTGMAAICEAARMSPGALYRYFASKTDIIRAIVAEEQQAAEADFARLDSARDFNGALLRLLEDTMDTVADPDYARLALEIAAEGARDAEIAAVLAEGQRLMLRQLTRAIQAAQERGQADPAADAAASARILLMLIDGAITPPEMAAPLSKRGRRAVLRRVIDGLLAPPG